MTLGPPNEPAGPAVLAPTTRQLDNADSNTPGQDVEDGDEEDDEDNNVLDDSSF